MTTSPAKTTKPHSRTILDLRPADARRRDKPARAGRPEMVRDAQIARDEMTGVELAGPQFMTATATRFRRLLCLVAFSPVARAYRAVIAEMRRRNTLHRLRSLDDWTLRDIGLTRGELSFVVRNGRTYWDR